MFKNNVYTFDSKYASYPVSLVRGFYGNGNKAVEFIDMDDGSQLLIATVNLGIVNPPDMITIKDYGENEGVLKFLKEIGFVGEVDHYEQAGFEEVPVCRLTPEGLKFFEG